MDGLEKLPEKEIREAWAVERERYLRAHYPTDAAKLWFSSLVNAKLKRLGIQFHPKLSLPGINVADFNATDCLPSDELYGEAGLPHGRPLQLVRQVYLNPDHNFACGIWVLEDELMKAHFDIVMNGFLAEAGFHLLAPLATKRLGVSMGELDYLVSRASIDILVPFTTKMKRRPWWVAITHLRDADGSLQEEGVVLIALGSGSRIHATGSGRCTCRDKESKKVRPF